MFEQLETCQPGNHLPVTGSSGSELRPLQGENGGHISFFSSVFIYFCSLWAPPSLSCLFSLIISLCIQTEDGDVALFRFSRCGVFYLFIFFLFSFLVLLVFPLPFLPCVRLEMFKKCAIHTYMHTHSNSYVKVLFSHTRVDLVILLLTSSSQASL